MVQCSQLFLLQLLWGWTVLPQLSLDFLVPRMHAFYIHFSKMPYIKLTYLGNRHCNGGLIISKLDISRELEYGFVGFRNKPRIGLLDSYPNKQYDISSNITSDGNLFVK